MLFLGASISLLLGCGDSPLPPGRLTANPGSAQPAGSLSASGGSQNSSDLKVSSVSVSPATITGGASATGTITLTAAAPAGGAQVSLSLASGTAATVPASVTVAPGQSTATFQAQTATVSSATTVTITATYNNSVSGATLTVNPAVGQAAYSGSGPVANWAAYQIKWDSSVSLLQGDGLYHQGIQITNSKGEYPVIGYSGLDPTCQTSGDTFNDFWTPIGNNIYWFINFPNLIYVKWVWYDNPTDRNVLQQTPCLDYSKAPKYN